MAKEETIEIQKELLQEGGKLKKYCDLILGERGFFKLCKYELVVGLTSGIPGAVGLLLRSRLYPKLLGRVGRNVTFGMGVVLRHPRKIFIGDNVVIDDHCVLDAKGTDNRGIFIGDGVFVGRNTILNCKNGDIILDDNANISANCMIFSASQVRVGADNLVAGYSYLVGGTHRFEDPTIPVLYQGRSSQGIEIGPGGWIGAHVTVFDGVRIGKHVVIGAGSAVHRNIPDYAIAAGTPVTIINKRHVKEQPMPKRKVSIGVINYNGENVLEKTMESIRNQDYEAISEILLVDNSSTDASVKWIREKYPNVKIYALENRGPNPARNLVLKKAQSELVLLVDNDIVLSPDTVTLLEEALSKNPRSGIAGAQIRFYDRPEEVQYNGADIHFAGGAVMNPYDLEKPVIVGALPAGVLLMDREKALSIGGFDEDFFYGWADGEFTFRMTLSGYPCLNVSKAKVFHQKEKGGLTWVAYQVRNRWWFILKMYNFRTLWVTLPAILIYQIAILGFLTLKGHLWDFIKGSVAVLGSLPAIWRKRKEFLKHKKVRDKEFLKGRGMHMMGGTGGSVVARIMTKILNLFFSGYWFFAKWLVK